MNSRYEPTDYTLVNAVRAVLGLAPIPGTEAKPRKLPPFVMVAWNDGNRHTPKTSASAGDRTTRKFVFVRESGRLWGERLTK